MNIIKKYFVVCLLIIINGCTMVVEWNPLFNGVEFDKQLSFSYKNIAVKINSVGFWNGWRGPYLNFELANYTADTLYINTRNIQFLIEDKIRTPKYLKENFLILVSGESIATELNYEISINEYFKLIDTIEYLPDSFKITLLPIKISSKSYTYFLPEIDFVPRYKVDVTKFL